MTIRSHEAQHYVRGVREDDIPEICKFPKTREELFYCFQKAAFQMLEDKVRQGIEKRSDSTLTSELDGYR